MTHKEGKLGALEDIQTVPTALPSVIEDITKTLDTAPSVITHTTGAPEATLIASTAPPPVVTNTTSKTSRVNDQFCLKNPPFKLKKRIEMWKSSTLRIGAGYCYGLKDENDLVIRSSVGNYTKHSDTKEDQEPVSQGEYVEEIDEKPSDLKPDSQGEYVEEVDEKPTDLKPSLKENETVGSSEIYTSELFQEINELANLSVHDKPVDQDSTGSDEMKTCGNCGIRFRDLRKHIKIQRCNLLPFPHWKSHRKSRE